MLLLATLLSVIVAGATQRITGIGFALVSAPLLVLTNGPVTGVLLANTLSLATNLTVLVSTWRQVEWRRVLLVAVPAVGTIPLGELVARQLPPRVLMVGIGTLVLAALAAVRLLRRSGVFAGRRGAVLAGAVSGFMNVTAGVGGPAVTLYAIGVCWPQASFVGSMQFYFALLNATSIAVKGLPHVPPLTFVAVFAALALGLTLGEIFSRFLPPEAARKAVIALAAAGAAATVLKGLAMP